MKLSNFSIGHRLKAGFLVVLGFSVLLAFVTWLQLRKVGDIVNEINDSWMVSVVDLNAIMDVISDARRAELHFVLAKTDAERESEERARTDAWKRMADPTRRYEATGISGPANRRSTTCSSKR